MNGELRIKNLALASELAKQLSHGFYGLEGLTRIKRIVAGYTEISAFFRPKQLKIALIYLVGIHYFPSLLKICVICEICERLFAQTLKTALQIVDLSAGQLHLGIDLGIFLPLFFHHFRLGVIHEVLISQLFGDDQQLLLQLFQLFADRKSVV